MVGFAVSRGCSEAMGLIDENYSKGRAIEK